MKVKLRADLSPEVLVKLREILIKHKVEWEEEIIVKDESKTKSRPKPRSAGETAKNSNKAQD